MVEFIPLVSSFAMAYVGVSALGFGVYLAISKIRGTSPWDEVEVRDNQSYQLVNRFLPLINLLVWTASAWFYFSSIEPSWTNVYLLMGVWLVAAAIIDYVAFVLIKHPLSADHRGFYLGQGPWIYLTYFAVFVSPLLYKILMAA